MKKIIFLTLLVSTLSGCSNDDVPVFSFETLPVSNITGIPDNFVVGETTTLNLSYIRPSTCHGFEGFEIEEVDNNTRNIAVIARLVEGRAPCADLVNEERTASFLFIPEAAGQVTLNFLNGTDGDGEPIFVTFNVPVLE